MIKRILEIARLYLFITYRSREMLVFGFAMPILFTFVIGQAIPSGDSGEDELPVWNIAVVNQDEGDLGEQLSENLDNHPSLAVRALEPAEAEMQVEQEEVAAALFIPPDFSQLVLAGAPLDLSFQMNLAQPVDAQVVEQAVLVALGEIESSVRIAESSVAIAERLGLFEQEGAPDIDQYHGEALAAAQEELAANLPVVVEARQGIRSEESAILIPGGMNQTSPGMIVIFTIFSVLAGIAALLLEREQGTLRRLLVMPMGKTALMSGKLLGILIVGITQIIILVLAGIYLFGVDWGQSTLALLLMIFAFAFSITGLGMLVGSLVRTYAQLDAFSAIIAIPMAGLGGAMWPIEIVPEFMQRLALFLPTGWAMRGFHDIITRGLGLEAVLLEAGVLVAFGVIFLVLGILRFRYE
jgi:ABC-2 type transport system permease protein